LSTTPGSTYAYWCVLLSVFVTALYSFRVFFLVFHGKERMDPDVKNHVKESPAVVTFPLVLLAIPSVFIGWFTIEPVLFGGFFDQSIFVLENPGVVEQLGMGFHGPWAFIVHAATASVAIYLAAAGALLAWFLYLRRPDLPQRLQEKFRIICQILDNKYYFDSFNEKVIAKGMRITAHSLWRGVDETVIDGLLVNGTARVVRFFSGVMRSVQSGYLYHYAFAMVVGLAILIGLLIVGR
jgi:NADH-quinone oxidoreductase subunit L